MLVFQEAYGMTGFMHDVLKRFAELGCLAVAPELYHRSGATAFPYADRKLESLLPHISALTDAGLGADAMAAHGWLESVAGVPATHIAAIGFCMGGRLAFLANALLPLRAAISFYGGEIAPRLLKHAVNQHGPGLYFWAGRDWHIKADERRAVEDALSAAGKPHTQVVFSQADHGFCCHERPWCYDPAAAREAWTLTLAFLRENDILEPEESEEANGI